MSSFEIGALLSTTGYICMPGDITDAVGQWSLLLAVMHQLILFINIIIHDGQMPKILADADGNNNVDAILMRRHVNASADHAGAQEPAGLGVTRDAYEYRNSYHCK